MSKQETTAPAVGSQVERVAMALANAEGKYLDGGGIYACPVAQWRDHWRWYLGGRGKGGTCDHSNQARWERMAVAAIGAMQEHATLPEGWRIERVGEVHDVLDERGRRIAWLTWEGMVYLERACTPAEMRPIAEALANVR